MIPEWDDLALTPGPAGWDRLAGAVEESRRASRWQRFTGWLTALRRTPRPWGMSGYRARAAEPVGDELDGAGMPREADALALAKALQRATHPYQAPPDTAAPLADAGPVNSGCERMLPADEAVHPLQVCGLPPGHAVHQTPAVVLGGGEQR